MFVMGLSQDMPFSQGKQHWSKHIVLSAAQLASRAVMSSQRMILPSTSTAKGEK